MNSQAYVNGTFNKYECILLKTGLCTNFVTYINGQTLWSFRYEQKYKKISTKFM